MFSVIRVTLLFIRWHSCHASINAFVGARLKHRTYKGLPFSEFCQPGNDRIPDELGVCVSPDRLAGNELNDTQHNISDR